MGLAMEHVAVTIEPIWSAIVLAAGHSSRFGGGKLRALYRTRPVIDWVLDAALAAPVAQVVVVWGGDPLIGEGLPKNPRLKSLLAVDHALGMGASLAAGLGGIDPQSQGVLVFLGDMPRVPALVIPDLMAAVQNGAMAAAPSFNGRRGHPVLIGQSLFARLLSLGGDQGAGKILDQLGTQLCLIPAPDDGCLFDIDRPEDLARE